MVPPASPTALRATRGTLALLALVLAACTTTSGATPSTSYTYSPPTVIDAPNSQTGPYVAVAVDNHFHDIHPWTRPPSPPTGRSRSRTRGPTCTTSRGGTHISVDIQPGKDTGVVPDRRPPEAGDVPGGVHVPRLPGHGGAVHRRPGEARADLATGSARRTAAASGAAGWRTSPGGRRPRRYPVVHEDHPVADLAGEPHLVGDDHHRHPLLGQAAS